MELIDIVAITRGFVAQSIFEVVLPQEALKLSKLIITYDVGKGLISINSVIFSRRWLGVVALGAIRVVVLLVMFINQLLSLVFEVNIESFRHTGVVVLALIIAWVFALFSRARLGDYLCLLIQVGPLQVLAQGSGLHCKSAHG